jgi:hypothetical protein
MDVVVIVEGTMNQINRDYISRCAWEAGYRHGMVVVPVVFTRDEWENGPERYSLFVQGVMTDGIVL